MSYGIIRVQKFTSGSVKGIEIHNKREKNISHSNPDIDFNKSENNYSLIDDNKNIDDKNKTYNKKIKERISELNFTKKVRKDAIVMCECLVTSDENFFNGISKDKQKEFFQKSFNWIKERYGEKNIISAIVHLDEKTPHMHIDFVPITKDNRLCAKDLFNKKTLFELHNDFYKEIGVEFNLNRGETREDKRRHLDVEDFKIATKKEEIKNEIYNLSQSKKDLEKRKLYLEIEKDTLNNKINSLRDSFSSLKAQEIKLTDISSIKTSKSVLGGKITLSQDDYNNLVNYANSGIVLDGIQKDYKIISKKYNELKKTSSFVINDKIKNANSMNKIQNENLELTKTIKYLSKFILNKGLQEELKKELQEKKLKKQIER